MSCQQLWAIQTKLTQEDSTKYLVDAFVYLGLNWGAFPFPPFVGQVPNFHWDGPVVYYGSTALVKRVSEDPSLRTSALFFNAETHRPDWYGPRFGEAYLNREAKTSTVTEFFDVDRDDDEQFFIRPNSGLKIFAGKVFTVSEFDEFIELSRGNTLLSSDTPIVFGPVKKIYREFRTWIVDGEVAAAVQYKQGSKMLPSAEVPKEVVEFAARQAKVCSPSPVFVLDVAETPDDHAVIEINCFHSSGFYLTEQILDVVAEVSNYVKRTG